jgi:hypothetical protein
MSYEYISQVIGLIKLYSESIPELIQMINYDYEIYDVVLKTIEDCLTDKWGAVDPYNHINKSSCSDDYSNLLKEISSILVNMKITEVIAILRYCYEMKNGANSFYNYTIKRGITVQPANIPLFEIFRDVISNENNTQKDINMNNTMEESKQKESEQKESEQKESEQKESKTKEKKNVSAQKQVQKKQQIQETSIQKQIQTAQPQKLADIAQPSFSHPQPTQIQIIQPPKEMPKEMPKEDSAQNLMRKIVLLIHANSNTIKELRDMTNAHSGKYIHISTMLRLCMTDDLKLRDPEAIIKTNKFSDSYSKLLRRIYSIVELMKIEDVMRLLKHCYEVELGIGSFENSLKQSSIVPSDIDIEYDLITIIGYNKKVIEQKEEEIKKLRILQEEEFKNKLKTNESEFKTQFKAQSDYYTNIFQKQEKEIEQKNVLNVNLKKAYNEKEKEVLQLRNDLVRSVDNYNQKIEKITTEKQNLEAEIKKQTEEHKRKFDEISPFLEYMKNPELVTLNKKLSTIIQSNPSIIDQIMIYVENNEWIFTDE